MAASIVIGLVASSECSAGSSRCRPPHFPIERLPFGSWARAFVAADFDGDGRTDLAAIGGDPPTLKVGLAELDGAFVGFESLPVGADPRDLVAGDVDGDGDIDLLVAVADANQVVIVRNDGAGGFDVVAALAAGEGTRSLAVGDVDGDGGLDLVAANGLAATVSVWLDACDPGIACGRTAPPFGPRVDLDAGPAPQSVRLADVDRDGNIDLLVCNASVEASTVALFRGLGDGSFAARLAVQAGRAPEGLVVVDLDGDGWLDLAVANAADETISVMRNATPRAGEPVFDPPQPSLAPKEPRRLAARDLAHDGFPELLVAAAQGSAIVRYENVDGVLAAGLPAIAVVAARALLVDDLDGDGRAEIVVGQDAAAPLVAHQQPNGFFADQFPLFEASNLAALVAADVLGDDARPDLVAGSRTSNVLEVWRNDRGEDLVPGATIVLPGDEGVAALAAVDLEGDGAIELLVGRAGGLAVVHSRSGEQFPAPELVALPHGVDAIAVHDIDDDGDPDVIAIGRIGNASDVSVLRNDGAGSLAIAATVFVGEAVSSAGVLDVDGDGRLDVVLCGVDHLPVLIADTEGGFALVEPFVVGAFPVARSAFTVDWTGDGDDELLLVGVGVGVIEPILGGAAWLTIMVPGGDNSAIAPLLRDVDGDGLDDLVYLNVPTTAGGPRVTERRREPGAGFAWPRHYGRAEGLASPLLDAAAFADFDGDGRLDAVFGASSIAWMLLGSCGSAPCAADLDGSGAVDGADLGALLAMWGAVGPRAAAADLDGNGVVDGGDVGAILAAWGECAK